MLCYNKLILIWISYVGIKFREDLFSWVSDFAIFLQSRTTNMKGLVLSFVSRLSLWCCFDRPHTAGLHQAIVLIYWVELFVPPWLLVIGVSQTSLMVGEFQSKALLALWDEETDPLAIRCRRDRLPCFPIVGIHA